MTGPLKLWVGSRFVAGLGVGALSGEPCVSARCRDTEEFLLAIVPLYNGEAAPKKIRGALLVLYQLQIIVG